MDNEPNWQALVLAHLTNTEDPTEGALTNPHTWRHAYATLTEGPPVPDAHTGNARTACPCGLDPGTTTKTAALDALHTHQEAP